MFLPMPVITYSIPNFPTVCIIHIINYSHKKKEIIYYVTMYFHLEVPAYI